MRLVLFVLLAATHPVPVRAQQPMAVVSIRQYQEVGPSNLHLYLYRLDGHLEKKLTSTPGLDDDAPAFDPQGKTIFFHRTSTLVSTKKEEGYALLDLQTSAVTPVQPAQLKSEQKIHEATLQATGLPEDDDLFSNDPSEGKDSASCLSPDGKYKLICKPDLRPSVAVYTRVKPWVYFLRSPGSAVAVSLESLPSYDPAFSNDYYPSPSFLEWNDNPFVLLPGFHALFALRHVDSTDGDSLWMLDLDSRSWTKMSQNGGWLYVIPGQSGVTLIRSSRYEASGGLTVTCGYLEIWSSTSKPVDLSPPVSLFHGATVFYGSEKTLILPDPDFGS